MIYRALVAIALIVVIVGSVMLGRQRGDTGATTTTSAPLDEAGYSAKQAELVETGADGRPMYTLNADIIRQKPSDGSIELEVVRMSVLASDGLRWNLSANRGQVREEATRIDLFGDVRVAGVLPPEADRAEIRTEMLTFNTQTEMVVTSAPVELAWSGQVLNAVGLQANLKTRRVQLESRVHGRFSP